MSKKYLGAAFIVILAAVLLVINVGAIFLPTPEMSEDEVLSISDQSKEYLSGLGRDVDIYVIQGTVYDHKFEMFMKEYASLSERIKLEFVDFEDAGELLEACGYPSDQELSSYAVVVKSDKRARLLDYYSMFYYYNPTFGQMSYSNYYEYYSMFSSSADYAPYLEALVYDSTYYFCGESLLSALVEYTALDIVPRAYFTVSHGENSATEGNFAVLLSAISYEYSTLSLTDTKSVPEDAGCLIINQPTSDLSVSEAEAVLDYMKSGGRMLLVTDEKALEMPNLMSVAAYYGLSAGEGFVTEKVKDDKSGEESESDTITPVFNSDHDIIAAMEGYSPKIIKANAINISAKLRPSQIVTPLITSSDKAYVGDPENKGVYNLGAAVEEEVEKGTSRLVWFTGAQSFNGEIDSADSLALLVYSTSWLNKTYTSEIGAIDAVVYGENMMQVPENAVLWCGALTLATAFALLGTGAFICFRRNKA